MSEEDKASRAKKFLADMKKSLSQASFERIVQALQTYKKTDNLDILLKETAVLTEDTNTHSLFRGKSSKATVTVYISLMPVSLISFPRGHYFVALLIICISSVHLKVLVHE